MILPIPTAGSPYSSGFPFLARLHRQIIFYYLEMRVFPIIKRPDYRAKRMEEAKRYIKVMTRGRKVRAAMVPEYEMGCKRILISDNFFDALNSDNVELVPQPIAAITEDGIKCGDGSTRSFDAIVYATGYDMEGHLFSIDVTGENGLTLKQAWKDGAQAYHGVMAPGFPNYFMATGPNTGVGTASVVYMIEQSVGWIMKCIRRAGKDRVVSVTQEATAAYNDRIQSAFPDTVWTSGCQSWYRKPDGRIEILYPHDARTYRRQMKRIDPKHVRFTPVSQKTRPILQAAK